MEYISLITQNVKFVLIAKLNVDLLDLI